jgi:hypothetical protein
MNKIKVGRLILSGLITLLVFIVLELVVEGVIARQLVSESLWSEWEHISAASRWRQWNWVLNLLIAFVNCTWVMWLYAALRPMFGVGTKTALITSAFVFVFLASLSFNLANLGLYPIRMALFDATAQIVELPIAVVVGAKFYEAG